MAGARVVKVIRRGYCRYSLARLKRWHVPSQGKMKTVTETDVINLKPAVSWHWDSGGAPGSGCAQSTQIQTHDTDYSLFILSAPARRLHRIVSEPQSILVLRVPEIKSNLDTAS